MILECPSCDARYELPENAFDKGGRDVRCANCKHTWYEDPKGLGAEVNEADIPDEEEEDIDATLAALREELERENEESDSDNALPPSENEFPAEEQMEQEDAEEKIPDAVVPNHGEKEKPAKKVKKAKKPISFKSRLISYLVAFLTFFILTFAFMLILKGPIMSSFPAVLKLFQMAGTPINVAGEGLVIETLDAQLGQNDKGEITVGVSGRIVNLTDKVITAPNLVATLKDERGVEGDSWIIFAPVNALAPDASFGFKSDYVGAPDNVISVVLTFDLGMGKKSKPKPSKEAPLSDSDFMTPESNEEN